MFEFPDSPKVSWPKLRHLALLGALTFTGGHAFAFVSIPWFQSPLIDLGPVHEAELLPVLGVVDPDTGAIIYAPACPPEPREGSATTSK